MQNTAAELEPLLNDPQFPVYMDELELRWKSEQRLRKEFYERIQPGDKWEFINGQIIMQSPAKEKHTEARQNLSFLLQAHVALGGAGKVRDETALACLTRNDYLPDILYFSAEKMAAFHPNTWKYPAPDFVVEVLSDSTESNDRGVKMKDYAAHGVRRDRLIDTDRQVVEQHELNASGKFELYAKKTVKDAVESQVVAGFSIPVSAIFDEQAKMSVLKLWLK